MTSANLVPNLQRPVRFPPVLSKPSDGAGGVGRSVTAAALVPRFSRFLQQHRPVARRGRSVTPEGPCRSPCTFVRDACAGARARRLARLPSCPADVPFLAGRAGAADILGRTSSAHVPSMASACTTPGTRNNDDDHAFQPAASSTDTRRPQGCCEIRSCLRRGASYDGVDLFTAAKWISN